MKIEYTMHGPIAKAAVRLLPYSSYFSTSVLSETYGKYYFPGVEGDVTPDDCLTAQLDCVERDNRNAVTWALQSAGIPVDSQSWLKLALILRLHQLSMEED